MSAAPAGATTSSGSSGSVASVSTAAAPKKLSIPKGTGAGIKVQRRITKPGVTAAEVLNDVEWTRRPAKISGADGEVVFKMDDAEVPASWSQLATDVAVSKYFRKAGVPTKSGAEESVRQLVKRVAHTLRTAGEAQGGYFASPEDAETFEAELSYYLVNQIGAFNSPVWFNCGLFHEYKILGSGGNFAVDLQTGVAHEMADAYTRPQVSACFIQSCGDSLDAIFDLVHDEARVFKYGSGSGTNFSKLRGKTERLSGGGTSSGLMSFLEVLDRAAGATKSGGITRRAAKMVVLDADHPEIKDFIQWKSREEKKVSALIAAGYSNDFNGEAYKTVSGQNANNSVRVSDKFMDAVAKGAGWDTIARTTGEVVEKLNAKELWQELAEAAWKCADPGLQYDDTINRWHTCKNTDRIYASNPCSEFVFLDDTACNLASLNLLKFLDEKTGVFDVEGYKHACRVFFLAQEIAVDLASYPTKRIAERSFQYRPLGLGYANLGTLLMVQGLPYDSDEGRAVAGAITAVMTGEAYALSAEMAATKGPFVGYAANREPMLDVMRMHEAASHQINSDLAPAELLAAAHECWARAVKLGEQHGYRNAQATVLAPTGTIGLLMDCDTTGVEPDFALIKFKKLAGGGSFKIVNQSVPRALKKLGYAPAEVQAIVDFVRGTASLKSTANFSPVELVARGLTEAEVAKIEKTLESVFDLRQAFAPHVLGAACLERLGLKPNAKGAAVLEKLGYTAAQIDADSLTVCGRQTVEGAPFLKVEHYAVFDCANRCGPLGTRYIEPMGHVRMMAAAQPFLSGAISKTINMPADATVADVEQIHTDSWKLGLKAIAIYRDGSKLSQPLSAGDKDKKKEPIEPAKDVKALAAQIAGMMKVTPEVALKMAEAALVQKPAVSAVPAPSPLAATQRRRLPAKRHGLTQEAKVGGNKVFLRTGEYEDGALGEIFIDMHKEGAALRSVMNCFAMLVSIALQYGVPLDILVEQFVFTRFEPQGPVQGHDRVKFATSVIDYVFRALAVEYLHRDDLAHVTPEQAASTPAANMGAEPGSQPAPMSPAVVAKAAQKPSNPPPAVVAGQPVAGNRRAASAQDELLRNLSGDAPFCDGCGHITVRNGTCYKCLNCGNSMGCS
ncbi:MAG: vitamin B12-dependent ribonucleotide reductase [Deltaproteobacteria bacterium]|nr:vitamin B12-dependent ribonucleotide reductase [Deltaproteobacteria bacterium]